MSRIRDQYYKIIIIKDCGNCCIAYLDLLLTEFRRIFLNCHGLLLLVEEQIVVTEGEGALRNGN